MRAFNRIAAISRTQITGPTNRVAFRRQLSAAKKGMQDEYGTMDSSGETFAVKNFELESGHVLPEAQARYSHFGQLNEKKDNLLVVCHALTGNSRLDQWWGTLLGK
jgi:homoserine acetyltransferase